MTPRVFDLAPWVRDVIRADTAAAVGRLAQASDDVQADLDDRVFTARAELRRARACLLHIVARANSRVLAAAGDPHREAAP